MVDEIGAELVLLDVCGADAAVVDLDQRATLPGSRVLDVLVPDVTVAVIDERLHAVLLKRFTAEHAEDAEIWDLG